MWYDLERRLIGSVNSNLYLSLECSISDNSNLNNFNGFFIWILGMWVYTMIWVYYCTTSKWIYTWFTRCRVLFFYLVWYLSGPHYWPWIYNIIVGLVPNDLRLFLLYGLTLIPAQISNHMPDKVCDEITHLFPNFNGCTVEVWEWISNFITYYRKDVITYPCWD